MTKQDKKLCSVCGSKLRKDAPENPDQDICDNCGSRFYKGKKLPNFA